MQFKLWLEEVEKDHNFWKQFFLGIWSLHNDFDGLSKNLAGFDSDRLKNTGEFQNLDPKVQHEILNRISQGNGTVGDLVDLAAGSTSIGI